MLVGGDQVAVAVQPQGAEAQRAQHPDDRAAPRVVRPSRPLSGELRAWPGDQSVQARTLFIAAIQELDGRVGAQFVQQLYVAVVGFIEDDGATGGGFGVQSVSSP